MDASHGRGVTPLGSLYYLIKYDVFAQAGALALILITALVLLKRKAILKRLPGRKKD